MYWCDWSWYRSKLSFRFYFQCILTSSHIYKLRLVLITRVSASTFVFSQQSLGVGST
jgi:hypothetical protein